ARVPEACSLSRRCHVVVTASWRTRANRGVISLCRQGLKPPLQPIQLGLFRFQTHFQAQRVNLRQRVELLYMRWSLVQSYLPSSESSTSPAVVKPATMRRFSRSRCCRLFTRRLILTPNTSTTRLPRA